MRRQTLLAGLTVALGLVRMPAHAGAQDMHQIRHIAWNLTSEADQVWGTLQAFGRSGSNADDDGATTGELKTAVRRFDESARQFATKSDNVLQYEVLRGHVRGLINQAVRIDELMDRSDVPDRVRQEWAAARGTTRRLGEVYQLTYAPARQLPRYEYPEDGTPHDRPNRPPYYDPQHPLRPRPQQEPTKVAEHIETVPGYSVPPSAS